MVIDAFFEALPAYMNDIPDAKEEKNSHGLFSSFRMWFNALTPVTRRIIITILLLTALFLFILGNIYVFRYAKNQGSGTLIGKTGPTPTPTPYPINRHGKLSFSVATGKKTGPQFAKGFIDPYDVKQESPQKLSFHLTHVIPIKSVQAVWQTDTKQTTVPLTLAEGTATDGRWEGAWVADDTYLYTLKICATATDGTEENKIDITLR